MKIREFDAELGRLRSQIDPAYAMGGHSPEWSSALGTLIIDKLPALKPQYAASRWDAVFELINQLTDTHYLSFNLGLLAFQFKNLKPNDRLSRLERIETRAESFDNEHYYRVGLVFDGLAKGGMGQALRGPVQSDRFDQYFGRAKAKLSSEPESLGTAITILGVAIRALEKSERTRRFDDLNEYAKPLANTHPEAYCMVLGG
jgi:hypothetical protein